MKKFIQMPSPRIVYCKDHHSKETLDLLMLPLIHQKVLENEYASLPSFFSPMTVNKKDIITTVNC
jgi:hypothetical protein